MNTHYIGFNEEISKIISELSSNTQIISSSAFLFIQTKDVYTVIQLFFNHNAV